MKLPEYATCTCTNCNCRIDYYEDDIITDGENDYCSESCLRGDVCEACYPIDEDEYFEIIPRTLGQNDNLTKIYHDNFLDFSGASEGDR